MTTETDAPVTPPRPVSPEMQGLYKLLLKSEKFLRWHNDWLDYLPLQAAAPHFTPAQLAKLWGVSVETIRAIFRHEPGVLKIGKPETRTKRGYFTLRIPEEVAERVHQRLAA